MEKHTNVVESLREELIDGSQPMMAQVGEPPKVPREKSSRKKRIKEVPQQVDDLESENSPQDVVAQEHELVSSESEEVSRQADSNREHP